MTVVKLLKQGKALLDSKDIPPYVNKISLHQKGRHAFVVRIDKSNKTVIISRTRLKAFPNPSFPAKCIRDIRQTDQWRVVDEEGKDIWPSLAIIYFFPDSNEVARPPIIRGTPLLSPMGLINQATTVAVRQKVNRYYPAIYKNQNSQ